MFMGDAAVLALAPPFQWQHEFCCRAKRDFYPEHEWNAVGILRGDNLLREVFFETAAPRTANLVLGLEIAMGVGLLVGARLARKGRFRQHAWCQSSIVLLNLAYDSTSDTDPKRQYKERTRPCRPEERSQATLRSALEKI
jgi:hypothetical protein